MSTLYLMWLNTNMITCLSFLDTLLVYLKLCVVAVSAILLFINTQIIPSYLSDVYSVKFYSYIWNIVRWFQARNSFLSISVGLELRISWIQNPLPRSADFIKRFSFEYWQGFVVVLLKTGTFWGYLTLAPKPSPT